MQVFIFFAIIALIVLIAGRNAFKNEPKTTNTTEDVSSGIEVDETTPISEPLVEGKMRIEVKNSNQKTTTTPPNKINKPKVV